MDTKETKDITNTVQVEHADTMGSDRIELVAKTANEAAHELTLRDAIACYPTAIFWSLMVSMCVIMEGMLLLQVSSSLVINLLTQALQDTTPFSSVTSMPTPSLRRSTANLSTTTAATNYPPPGRPV